MTGLLAPIDALEVHAFTVPTAAPETDGTSAWSQTTLVVVHLRAAGQRGYGWTYGPRAIAQMIADVLAPEVRAGDAGDIARLWSKMSRAARTAGGRPGLASAAIAAVDVALWDLKARLLGTSVVTLMGRVREAIPAYASGGFTSYSVDELREQLGRWASEGFSMVEMKVGRDPFVDYERVVAAREAIGRDVELFVDASGAYGRKQALAFAMSFADLGVSWLEEPVPGDDVDGLRLLRDRAPEGMDVAAGAHVSTLPEADRLLAANAVDVLQLDATRIAGFTGFLRASTLCEARSTPCSAQMAPALHAHVACCTPMARHIEYFHDHVRVENMLFDGVLAPREGMLRPDADTPGLAITPKWDAMEPYKVWSSTS